MSGPPNSLQVLTYPSGRMATCQLWHLIKGQYTLLTQTFRDDEDNTCDGYFTNGVKESEPFEHKEKPMPDDLPTAVKGGSTAETLLQETDALLDATTEKLQELLAKFDALEGDDKQSLKGVENALRAELCTSLEFTYEVIELMEQD